MKDDPSDEEILLKAVAKLNAHVVGVVIALVLGVFLFLATMVLVVKGGPDPGPHLSLLSQYFPGYSVTMAGAFIGLFYAALVGYGVGYAIGKIYNRIVTVRNP